MKRPLILIIFLVFALGACQQDKSVSRIYSFSDAVWQRFNYLNFEFPIEEANETYDILALLRYNEKFPSQALIVNLVMYLPSGEERIREYQLKLKNDDGEWLGEKKTGYYELFIPIRKDMSMGSEPGVLKFEIESLMTKYYTSGMVEFGIVLEPSR